MKKRSLLQGIAIVAIATLSACTSPERQDSPERSTPAELDAKWSQLKRGMTQQEVRALMGRPVGFTFDQPTGVVTYRYPFGTLTFTDATGSSIRGRLDRWNRY